MTSPSLHVVVLHEFRIRSKQIYFRNLSWIRILGVIVDHCMRTNTMRRETCDAKVIVPESVRQDLYDLEVGYVGFIINACAGA
jgi:hypothetical protein